MATSGGGAHPTGIRLTITFASALDTVSLERDTDVAFGTSAEIASLTGGTQSYEDPLPLNNTTYYYRAKSTRTGYVSSSYSAAVSGKPVTLSGPAA